WQLRAQRFRRPSPAHPPQLPRQGRPARWLESEHTQSCSGCDTCGHEKRRGSRRPPQPSLREPDPKMEKGHSLTKMYRSWCVHVLMDGKRVGQGWPSIARSSVRLSVIGSGNSVGSWRKASRLAGKVAGGDSEIANIGVNADRASALVGQGDGPGAGPLRNGEQREQESPND